MIDNSRAFQGYDQWKTASPFDDCDEEHCAYCGADLPDDVTGYSDADENAVMDGFCNTKCLSKGINGDISPRYGLPPITSEQEKRLDEIESSLREWQSNHKVEYAKLEDILQILPEGDFCWENDDPGDPHVWCCGESDCPTQWHETFYNTTFKREHGILSIEVNSGDADGNWEIDSCWQHGEVFDKSEVAYAIGPEPLNDYFVGWAEYWLNAAVTGKDPCDQALWIKPNVNWVDFCLDSASKNVKFLTK